VELANGKIGFRILERLPDRLEGFDDDPIRVSLAPGLGNRTFNVPLRERWEVPERSRNDPAKACLERSEIIA
jgi:hypothetical protein